MPRLRQWARNLEEVYSSPSSGVNFVSMGPFNVKLELFETLENLTFLFDEVEPTESATVVNES
jgi:hypothetical protein